MKQDILRKMPRYVVMYVASWVDVACVNLIPVSVLLGSEKAKKVEDEDTHGNIGLHS